MDKDIKSFIEQIKLNTGLTVGIYDLNGKIIAGEQTFAGILPTDFEGVLTNEQLGVTCFMFNRKGVRYGGYISGATEKEKAFAFLIRELAGKTENKYTDAKSFVKALVMGDVNAEQVPSLCKHFGVVNRALFALAVQTEPKNKTEIEDFLESYNYGGKDFAISLDDDVVVLVKYVDVAVKEYCSTTEYAEMLCLSIYEETGLRVRVGVGGKVSGILGVGQSFSQAISAVRMMSKINSPGSVHSYREFALEKALEELPENRRMEYVKILAEDGTKEFFKDKEMVKTAQAFLDNNLNASETSRALYIHRNTLNYRLDKIQNLTGFNLRKFADAVTFKMITVLYELLG